MKVPHLNLGHLSAPPPSVRVPIVDDLSPDRPQVLLSASGGGGGGGGGGFRGGGGGLGPEAAGRGHRDLRGKTFNGSYPAALEYTHAMIPNKIIFFTIYFVNYD